MILSEKASKRTKERFKAHAPFKVLERGMISCLPEECLLLKFLKTDWLGWIPANEIILQDSK